MSPSLVDSFQDLFNKNYLKIKTIKSTNSSLLVIKKLPLNVDFLIIDVKYD